MGIAVLFTQTCSVQTYLGSGAFGDQFAAATDVACYIEDGIKETRNGAGDQVVSTARVFAALDAAPTDPAVAGQLTPGSKITVNGRATHVLSVARLDGAGPVSVHHVEAQLA